MSTRRTADHPVVVVDDDSLMLRSLQAALRSAGIEPVVTCRDSRRLMTLLAEREADALLLDLVMPGLSGFELLPTVREEHPDLPVIIVSGLAEVGGAVDCMRLGAFHYLVKPVEKSVLVATVQRAVEIQALRRENLALKSRLIDGELAHPGGAADCVYREEKMRSLLLYVEAVAESRQPVLITGETGTGKELVARALHRMSGRRGELVPVNVAGFDDTMFADSLFGHLKGAFTGADRPRGGLVERAENGTLFLDEIGELGVGSQVKLLRLLENGEYYPLGSDLPRRSRVRVVVATNRDLEEETARGRFRKDLFYRLRTHHVHLPPLRERLRDLPGLVDCFVRQAAEELGRPSPPVAPELHAYLRTLAYPGNIRELKAMIFDALSRHVSGPLSVELIAAASGGRPAPAGEAARDLFLQSDRLPTIREATELLVEETMRRAGGNMSAAARLLGITPQALSQRLRRTLKRTLQRRAGA